jgi:hypothetical protein
MRHPIPALPQYKLDEIAIAYALLLGTELKAWASPVRDEHARYSYLAVEPHDVPQGSGDRVPANIGSWLTQGDAARAFLRRRGFFQCVYTGDIMTTSGGNK